MTPVLPGWNRRRTVGFNPTALSDARGFGPYEAQGGVRNRAEFPAQAQVEAWVRGRAERVGVYGPFLQPGFKTVKEVCHFSIFQKHFEWYFE